MTSILIVADNPAEHRLIRESLNRHRNHNFNCVEATSLQSALDIIEGHDFDALVIDLDHSGACGLDAIRRIMAEQPETAIVVLSGAKNEHMALKIMHYGAQDCLDKRQLARMELGKAILNSVERKKVEQEKKDLLHDLDDALRRVELLENLLPLCPSCNKIYGADNRWHQIEVCSSHFVVGRTSQSICPDCLLEMKLEQT